MISDIESNRDKVYVLRSSGIGWKSGELIVRYSQKKECISFVFYCFENLSIAITLKPLIRFSWGFQQNVPLQMRTSIQCKLKMSHVRLPTDSPRSHHIYYYHVPIIMHTYFIYLVLKAYNKFGKDSSKSKYHHYLILIRYTADWKKILRHNLMAHAVAWS